MKTPQRAQTQKFTIYLGRNNPFFVVLKWFGVALTAEEMAEITRVDLMYKDVVISSTLYPTLIDFTTHADESRVYFDLAGLDLEVGEDESCEIIVFTDEYADGVVHQPILHLTVTDEALGDAALIDPLRNISLDDLQDVDTSGGAAGYVLTQQADGTWAPATPLTFPGFTDLFTDYGFTDNSSDWDTAYGWGDHAGLYDAAGTAAGLVVGLLDETAHDLLDHTGLTGCGGLDETAHDLLDHTGLTGVPSISGLLDETAHDLLDHSGLTGIPSVSGLLDETSHDLLDHTGLTGVPDVSGYGDIVTYDAADFAPALGDDDNYVTDAEKANLHAPGSDNQDLSGYLLKSTYDANSILAATTDDTPAAVTVAEQSIIGRIAGGNIDDLGLLASKKFLSIVNGFHDASSALPSTPSTGDRWICSVAGNGWTLNYVYTYNGSSWLEIVPQGGDFYCSVQSGTIGIFKYLNSRWVCQDWSYKDLGTSSAGTYYFNGNQYQYYKITIGASTTTIAPTGTYTSGFPCRVVLYIINGAAYTVAWNSAIKWAGGTAPTLTASGTDIVVFATIDGGTTWQADVVGKDHK